MMVPIFLGHPVNQFPTVISKNVERLYILWSYISLANNRHIAVSSVRAKRPFSSLS